MLPERPRPKRRRAIPTTLSTVPPVAARRGSPAVLQSNGTPASGRERYQNGSPECWIPRDVAGWSRGRREVAWRRTDESSRRNRWPRQKARGGNFRHRESLLFGRKERQSRTNPERRCPGYYKRPPARPAPYTPFPTLSS